ILWIDRDAADVLGCFQANVFPRAAAVVGFVNTVAVSDAALAIVLAGADPDCQGVLRVECDGADRIRAFVVKDRGPRDTRVDCLPHTAGCHRNAVYPNTRWIY